MSKPDGKSVVLTRKAALVMGACVGFLQPKLAADAAINFYPVLKDVTAKNYGAKKGEIAKRLIKQISPHLIGQDKAKFAKDASVEGLVELLDGLDRAGGGGSDDLATEPSAGLPMAMNDDDIDELDEQDEGLDADMHAGLRAFLEEKGMDPADIEKACAMVGGGGGDEDIGSVEKSKAGLDAEPGEEEGIEAMKQKGEAKDKKVGKDEPPPFKGRPEPGGTMTKGGMSKDEVNKAVRAAAKVAEDAAVQRMQRVNAEVRDAERYVRSWVGDLPPALAHDSAEAVYRTALEALGQDVKDIHPSAYKSILSLIPKPTDSRPNNGSDRDNGGYGMDSGPASEFTKMFPGTERIEIG